MSFFTDLTPGTPRATSPALLTFCAESTKPLNWTSPLNVSTLIWSTFSDGSSKIAAFTLVVIAESSMYSPELSRVGVDAHPRNAVTNVMQTRKLNIRCLFTMMLSPLVWFVHERHVSKAPIPDIPGNTNMMLLSASLRYRFLFDKRNDRFFVLSPVS